MVEYVSGDLFRLAEQGKAYALVNPVNTRGVSGAGVALAVRDRFPEAFRDYRNYCLEGRLRPGRILVSPTDREYPVFIVHAATKDHWSDPSDLGWIQSILADLDDWADVGADGRRIVLPFLGCGCGKLPRWAVRIEFDRVLGPSPVEYVVITARE